MTRAADATDQPAGADRTLDVLSPEDGSLLATLPVHTPEQVSVAVERAKRVQHFWASLSLADRERRLRALLPVLGQRSDRIVDSIMRETGKPEVEALAEVVVVTDLLRYYAKHAQRLLRPRRRTTGWALGKSATIYREPYGVIAVISPWNYPFILSMNPVLTALMAGNGVVVKPSEHTPLTALLALELLSEAHIPEGLVNVVVGGPSTGAALVAASVDKVVFTGSHEAGRAVMRAAAESVTPVCMELGGKDPAIVLEDADLERAAAGVLFGAFFNAGQTCISVERALVVDTVYDAFLSRLTPLAESLRPGAARGDLGPITTQEQLGVVERHINEATELGARVLTGGRRADPVSNVVLPTILVNVTPSMAVFREETFGPVLVVHRVDDQADAIAKANEGAHSLWASIWTGDLDRGRALAREIRAGGVCVNDVLTHYAIPGLPMGGVEASGFGRTGGPEGLEELTRTRTVLVHRWGLGTREPYWFPYRKSTVELMRGLLTWRTGGGMAQLIRAWIGRGR